MSVQENKDENSKDENPEVVERMDESTDEENNKYSGESDREMSSNSSDHDFDDSSILSNESR